MKNILTASIFIASLWTMASCGEDPKPEPPPADKNPLQNLIQDGANELTEELSDSNSTLREVMDTVGDVFDANKEKVGETVGEGLDKLKEVVH